MWITDGSEKRATTKGMNFWLNYTFVKENELIVAWKKNHSCIIYYTELVEVELLHKYFKMLYSAHTRCSVYTEHRECAL